jgi:hypothetical protein
MKKPRKKYINMAEGMIIALQDEHGIKEEWDTWLAVGETYDFNVYSDGKQVKCAIHPGKINKEGYWETDYDTFFIVDRLKNT